MRKFLLGLILSLFLFQIVYAHDFEFELIETLYTGVIGGTYSHARVKGYYDPITETWFVYIPKRSGGSVTIDIEQYDLSWTQLDTDTQDCSVGADKCYDADCNYVIAEDRYYECIGREDDATPDFVLYKYFFDNQSFTTVDTRSNFATYPRTLAVSNRYEDLSGVPSPLTLWNSFIRQNDLYYSLENDLSSGYNIDIPSVYHQPNNVQAVYCNDMYIMFLGNSSTLFGLVYDLNLNYQDVYSFKPSGFDDITYGVETIDDVLYVAIIGEISGTIRASLQAWECESDYDLINIYSEIVNQGDIDPETLGISEDNIDLSNTESDIVLYYHLNDTDSSITDYSGLGHTGVYGGVLWGEDGWLGDGLGFEGIDDFIETTYSQDFNFTSTDEFTVSAWIYWHGVADVNDGEVIGHYSSTYDRRGWMLQVRNNQTRFAVCSDGTIGSCVYSTDTNIINKNNWYWVLGNWNGTHTKVYVNATLSTDVEAIDTVYGNSSVDVRTARQLSQAYFDGVIDEVILWNRSLTDNEITNIYNNYTVLTGDNISSPYLTKDDNDIYYIFYELSNEVKVSYENPCFCSDWVNTTECQENKIKQTRNCHPDLCEIETETRYVDSVYCAKEYNRSLGIYEQEYESEVICYECESDWIYFADGETTAECEPIHYTIPSSATNIFTNSTAISVLDGEGCENGDYDLEVCNPSYDCDQETFSCEYPVNFTTKNNEAYGIGDIVTSKMKLRVDSSCRCPRFLLGDKIKRFKVLGVTCISYDIACIEEWYCLNEEYKALKHIDCSSSNQTLCEFGCSDGECITDTTQREDSPANVLFWLNLVINPNTTWKFIWSLFISGIVGVIGISIAKGKNDILFFLVGFGIAFSVFVLIGWIPAIIILVMVFFVLVYALLKGIK